VENSYKAFLVLNLAAMEALHTLDVIMSAVTRTLNDPNHLHQILCRHQILRKWPIVQVVLSWTEVEQQLYRPSHHSQPLLGIFDDTVQSVISICVKITELYAHIDKGDHYIY